MLPGKLPKSSPILRFFPRASAFNYEVLNDELPKKVVCGDLLSQSIILKGIPINCLRPMRGRGVTFLNYDTSMTKFHKIPKKILMS